jgi:ribosomal protein L37AE/L43A
MVKRNRRYSPPCQRCGTTRYRTLIKGIEYACRFCGQTRLGKS